MGWINEEFDFILHWYKNDKKIDGGNRAKCFYTTKSNIRPNWEELLGRRMIKIEIRKELGIKVETWMNSAW